LRKIDEFHLNNISNGFAASAIININGAVPDEELRSDYERSIREKFAGEDNAGKFIIA